MSEYVEEISDPKNRAETDAYIKQLESQGEVPTDKEVIRPEKGYVVKFKHTKVKVAEDKKKKGEVRSRPTNETHPQPIIPPNVAPNPSLPTPTIPNRNTKRKNSS